MTALVLERPRPMATGGGGTVIEMLLGLATGVAATLAALAWRRRPATEPTAPSLPNDPTRDGPTKNDEEQAA